MAGKLTGKMALRTLSGTTDRRVDKLLTLLADNAMIVVSGGKNARGIGVARSTLWRGAQRVREVGGKGKKHPPAGFQNERGADVIMPNMLPPRVGHTSFSERIYQFF